MKKLLLITLLFIFSDLNGQNVLMNTSGTVNVSRCGNNFFDSGGSGSNYSNNENGVVVICPATAGTKLVLTFTAFSLENNYDFLSIYDGNSVAAPLLGVFTGTNSPGIIQAGSSNSSGCLTARFTSDGGFFSTDAGWQLFHAMFPARQLQLTL